jgi:hypothetical protein
MSRVAWCSVLAVLCSACSQGGDPPLGAAFSDDFSRSELGSDWRNTGGPYEIVDGALRVAGARNHPLWLRRRLPDDVRVTVEARSDSPEGDIKFEVFGDGRSFAQQASYTATSYVVIFGGWRNSRNVIARMDEHGDDRLVKTGPRVEQGRRYRIKLERRGQSLRWWVDDELILELVDPEPLRGPGHDHFAFNNWETPLSFDNLRITPLR